MHDKIKQRVLNAFLLVMRPVVRILLRYGIGFREFSEVAKTAFVDVASTDFGLRGRPTNISRVAVMTGLSRKEVKRLREKIAEGESAVSIRTTALSDVLHHWHAEREFTDSSGNPVALPFSGPERSFTSLVKKFGGDIPAGAMRTEMQRVGEIAENNDGDLIVIDRTFKAEDADEKLITVLVHGVYAQLSNAYFNLRSDRGEPTWPNRIAYAKFIRAPETRQLRRVTKDRIVDFAESIDDVFMAYESLKGNGSEEKNRVVAVGVYYFEERDDAAEYEW